MLRKGEKIGEYLLLDRVGSGGFGDVWKAEKRTRVDVNYFALKFFRPKDDRLDLDMIRKEIDVWKRLKGLPHIISIIELDQFDDYVYVVSDFADGGSLEKWLRDNNGKASSIDEAVKITLEILAGLERLHEKGFVHRDMKPDNVLITNGSHCLADFGISREIKSQSKATSTAGTMEYMPPEAFAKNASITKQTDIWAVGVILQKLLTGKLPYPQDDQPSLISAILYSDPEKMPSTIPRAFHRVVDKALEKERENRFATATAMQTALQAALIAHHNAESSAAPVIVPEDFPSNGTAGFNDLETIRIDTPVAGGNPTIEIKRDIPADSIITKESQIDRPEMVPVVLPAIEAAAAARTGKSSKMLWIGTVFILGILAIGAIGGVFWFGGSTPANSNNVSGTNSTGNTANVVSATPVPPTDKPETAETASPGTLPTPAAAQKNPIIVKDRPRAESTPVRAAAIPPKPKKTPKQPNNPDDIFKR